MGKQRIKPNYRRRALRLPDLDHCKLAALNSLGSPASRRLYEYAIEQFVAWYCSEPRLAFNRIVVVRYRMHLESRGLAANTINQQLAAVRRLAHEAADSGLLSPKLAAGISRVKGVKQLGFRSGNWLSAEQSSEVLKHAYGGNMRAKRDYAMLAMLFGCGFRRSELAGLELAGLELGEIQMRQGHWAAVDLIGKGGHIAPCPSQDGQRRRSITGHEQPGSRRGGSFEPSPGREGVGERDLAECCVVRSQELLRESGFGAHCTSRLAANLCEAMPHQRWRAGVEFNSCWDMHPSRRRNATSVANRISDIR